MLAAVAEAGLATAALDENELEKLWQGGYRSATRLRAASREGLAQAGLSGGAMDIILTLLRAKGEKLTVIPGKVSHDVRCKCAGQWEGLELGREARLLGLGEGNPLYAVGIMPAPTHAASPLLALTHGCAFNPTSFRGPLTSRVTRFEPSWVGVTCDWT